MTAFDHVDLSGLHATILRAKGGTFGAVGVRPGGRPRTRVVGLARRTGSVVVRRGRGALGRAARRGR